MSDESKFGVPRWTPGASAPFWVPNNVARKLPALRNSVFPIHHNVSVGTTRGAMLGVDEYSGAMFVQTPDRPADPARGRVKTIGDTFVLGYGRGKWNALFDSGDMAFAADGALSKKAIDSELGFATAVRSAIVGQQQFPELLSNVRENAANDWIVDSFTFTWNALVPLHKALIYGPEHEQYHQIEAAVKASPYSPYGSGLHSIGKRHVFSPLDETPCVLIRPQFEPTTGPKFYLWVPGNEPDGLGEILPFYFHLDDVLGVSRNPAASREASRASSKELVRALGADYANGVISKDMLRIELNKGVFEADEYRPRDERAELNNWAFDRELAHLGLQAHSVHRGNFD